MINEMNELRRVPDLGEVDKSTPEADCRACHGSGCRLCRARGTDPPSVQMEMDVDARIGDANSSGSLVVDPLTLSARVREEVDNLLVRDEASPLRDLVDLVVEHLTASRAFREAEIRVILGTECPGADYRDRLLRAARAEAALAGAVGIRKVERKIDAASQEGPVSQQTGPRWWRPKTWLQPRVPSRPMRPSLK